MTRSSQPLTFKYIVLYNSLHKHCMAEMAFHHSIKSRKLGSKPQYGSFSETLQ